ncbi:MAG: YggS family pyridoxal phosphate-dependent enzyme [Solirubrobacterales bacterium]
MASLIESIEVETVRANVAIARERIADAAVRAGRDSAQVELLAATKYVPLELMGKLVEAGIVLAGENTAQDLAAKHERLSNRITFDFIGHLQSRKTKDVLPLVRLIHSVESASVVARIERHATAPVEVLLEVNASGEQSKFGLTPSDVDPFIDAASTEAPKVRFAGLMTMPPFTDDPERARPCFSALYDLAQRLRRDWGPQHGFKTLSMGTSQDYEVAVEEGATIVRLGAVLYE